jgi:hypothetical protein
MAGRPGGALATALRPASRTAVSPMFREGWRCSDCAAPRERKPVPPDPLHVFLGCVPAGTDEICRVCAVVGTVSTCRAVQRCGEPGLSRLFTPAISVFGGLTIPLSVRSSRAVAAGAQRPRHRAASGHACRNTASRRPHGREGQSAIAARGIVGSPKIRSPGRRPAACRCRTRTPASIR